jgi:2-oxoglutarate dehydrogenase E1 component
MTPKSLLRLPAARSTGAELTEGAFLEVVPDPDHPHPSLVSRVILCQGKMYYDLLKARTDRQVRGAALVRVEQLYPFPADQLREILEHHQGTEVWWVQEEPENMGAWYYMERVMRDRLGVELKGVTREESASPATGSLTLHQQEQAELVERAFEGL